MDLKNVQKLLQENKIDGWLVFDFQGRNDVGCQFLQIPQETHLTRRFFYWIPAKGQPIKLVHSIESFVLDYLPGEAIAYTDRQSLEQGVSKILKGVKSAAMEFSPRCNIPYVSKVDGGTVDLVRSFGVEVVSSAPILQYYTSVLSDEQIKSHIEAGRVLDQAAAKAWEYIGSHLKQGKTLTEYDVVQFLVKQFHQNGCVTDADPVCGVNANSANPHYAPPKKGSLPIKKGDFIIIDLWCRKNVPGSIFADIARVAIAAERPTPRQVEIFQIVRRAQKSATAFLEERFKKKQVVKGYEADQIPRKIIEDAGFGQFFTHRTGHNIYMQPHGPGANLDSFETLDDRPLIPRTAFSVEPGIYFPGDFGIRLEHDVCIHESGKMEITGGIQEEIVTLI